MYCLRCRTRVAYSWLLSWWCCRCRVWATDERIARGVN